MELKLISQSGFLNGQTTFNRTIRGIETLLLTALEEAAQQLLIEPFVELKLFFDTFVGF